MIRRVINGDTDAYRILVTRYERMVFRLVRNLIANAHTCEDLAQDTFLAAFANLRSYDPNRGAFSTWLFAIARNRCVNSLKPPGPILRAASSDTADPRSFEFPRPDPELFALLDDALAALSIEQKTAFVLSEFCEMSQQQISEVERTSLGTVKSRISRAKARLRAALSRLVEET